MSPGVYDEASTGQAGLLHGCDRTTSRHSIRVPKALRPEVEDGRQLTAQEDHG